MTFRNIAIACFTGIIIGLAIFYCYPESKIPTGTVVDKIVVNKSKREMLVYAKDKVVVTYKVALGKEPIGKKQVEGDHKTPEGTYTIYAKNPNSAYHKNLGISYPNAADIAVAKQIGKPPGGDVKIHGMNNKRPFIGRFHTITDWTNGCIALTDEEVDDLYEHTPVGTPIIIQP